MERKQKLAMLDEVVDLVEDGMTLAIGGYLNNNHPMALIRGVVRKGVKNLFIITCIAAGIEADMLIGAGCVKTIHAPYVGAEWLGIMPNFRRKAEMGEIEIKECDEMYTVASLRAAAVGLPFYPVRVGLGTNLIDVNKDLKVFNDPIKGEKLIAVPPIKPDVAIIHAQKADPYGNVQHMGSVFLDALMAQAADKVVVTVEQIIPPEEVTSDPLRTTILGYLVDYVVKVPYGAHPSSCHGFYRLDEDFMREYLRAAREPDTYREHLQKYVYGIKTHEEYLETIGIANLLRLNIR